MFENEMNGNVYISQINEFVPILRIFPVQIFCNSEIGPFCVIKKVDAKWSKSQFKIKWN